MQVHTSPQGGIHVELFNAPSTAEVKRKMEERDRELRSEGFTFVRRSKIGRNAPCPCGSGLKLKKCCIGRAR